MNWFDDRVWRCRQEAVHKVRFGDRLRLSATIAFVFSPEASKCKERPGIIEREPNNILLAGRRILLGRIPRSCLRGPSSGFPA